MFSPPAYVMNRKRALAAAAGGRDQEPAAGRRIEVPMFKPIVVEALIILLAALSYLVERHHSAVKQAENARAAAVAQTADSRPGSESVPGRSEWGGKPLDTAQPVRQMVTLSVPIAGTLSQDLRQPGSLQLIVDVQGSEAPAVKLGQQLGFQALALPAQSFSGQVVGLAPDADPAASALQIRFAVPNPQHLLHPGMLVRGQLEAGERIAWVVPGSAVLRLHDTDYIVVRDGQRYRRMAVTGQLVEEGRYAITGGVSGVVPTVVSDVGQWLSQLAGEG